VSPYHHVQPMPSGDSSRLTATLDLKIVEPNSIFIFHDLVNIYEEILYVIIIPLNCQVEP
jgi:hypothetical protein